MNMKTSIYRFPRRALPSKKGCPLSRQASEFKVYEPMLDTRSSAEIADAPVTPNYAVTWNNDGEWIFAQSGTGKPVSPGATNGLSNPLICFQ